MLASLTATGLTTWGRGEVLGGDEILQKEKSRKFFKTDFREFKASPVWNANSFEQISFQNVKRF